MKNIIITTIQKLSTFIKKNKTHEVYLKHVVFIFDECHRSQFGEMHKSIIKKFNIGLSFNDSELYKILIDGD